MLPIPVKRQMIYFWHFRRFITRNPETFLEKIQWRTLYDRRDLIAIGGDKVFMKEYASSVSNVMIPKTLWAGEDIGPIMDVDWPCDWVLKPRSGSGYAAFGSGRLSNSGISPEVLEKWRSDDHYSVQGVWAYGQAEPGYILEQRIPTDDGRSPDDYRFFVFGGRVRVIQIDTPRTEGVRRRFYSENWEPFTVTQGGKQLGPIQDRPESLGDMVRIAEEIGELFDFIRVDLYHTRDGIWFGEITPYPTGGVGKFSDPAFDRMLGGWWKLPKLAEVCP